MKTKMPKTKIQKKKKMKQNNVNNTIEHNSNNLEIRNLGSIVERDYKDSRRVEGYAIVFDSRSEDLGFYEYIDRGAVSQELVDSCDIFALLNHDEEKVLARANHGAGSLSLTVDDRGLKYEFDAADTQLGNDLLEYLKRGEITTSSFAFYVDPRDPEAETWERKDGVNYRTIHKIALIADVSPVWKAAYSATSVSQRSLDKCKELEDAEKKAEEERKQAILESLDKKLEELDNLKQ